MINKVSIFFLQKIKILIFTAVALLLSPIATAQMPHISTIIVKDSLQNIVTKQHSNQGFDTAKINSILKKHISDHADNGFPFARAVCDSVVIKNSDLKLYYSLSPGKLFKIENIYIPVQSGISTKYICRTVFMHKGTPFSQRRLLKTDALINNTGIIQTQRPTEVEFNNQGADIYIYVQKLKSNSAEAGIALMYNALTQKYYPTGNALLHLSNNFGKGECFDFEWHGYRQNSQKIFTEIRLPYIFNTAVTVAGSANIDKTDSLCLNVSLRPELDFAVTDILSVKTDVQTNWLMPQNNDSTTGKTSSLLYGADIQWLCASSHNTIKISTGAAIGARKNNGEKFPCQELRLALTYKQLITSKLELITHSRFQTKICSEETYIYEKYRFGGTSTLRGFSENYFFADCYAVMSNTLRYKPYGSFNIFGFYDIGTYSLNHSHDTPSGTGLGIGLTQNNTSIDIAWAIGREYGATLPLKQAKIHLNIKVNF